MKKSGKYLLLLVCLFIAIPCWARPVRKEKKALFDMSQAEYNEMLNLSLLDKGNNYRLKKVIEKLRDSQHVYVTALGGSVTEGVGPEKYLDGYAYKFIKKISAEYTPNRGSKIIFNDAGLSGTSSLAGIVRYENDVIRPYDHTPDLLILEFAVNDGSGDEFQRAYEGIIREVLSQNEDTAIIALYSAATYTNQQSWMTKISEYYEIPQVSVSDLVKQALAEKKFTQKQYFVDNVHPTKEGHEIQADCLVNLFKAIDGDKINEKNPVPENAFCYRAGFWGMTKIKTEKNNSDVKLTPGCFSSKDKSGQLVLKSGKTNFPENWYHVPGKKGDSLIMEIECKNLIIIYQKHGNWDGLKFGYAEVYVDDNLVQTLDGTGGWNNAVPELIIDNEVCEKHIVEIKMAPGSEKKGFVILSMGYSK